MELIKELMLLEGKPVLGSKIEFAGFASWKKALPAKSTFHKDGNLERAQALGKDFEGVAGTFNHSTNAGWIYAYYTKKENLVEASSAKKIVISIDMRPNTYFMTTNGTTATLTTDKGVSMSLAYLMSTSKVNGTAEKAASLKTAIINAFKGSNGDPQKVITALAKATGLQAKDFGVEDDGTLNESTASTLMSKLASVLKAAEKKLSSAKNSDTSYNIGGNMNAVKSGVIDIRPNYTEHSHYGHTTRWDSVLTIGNNAKGIDALAEVKKVYEKLMSEAEKKGGKLKKDTDGFCFVTFEDSQESFVLKYEYARAFCWVGYRKAG